MLDLPGVGLGRHGHGVAMLIMRVSEPTFEDRRHENRVYVRFRVNDQPDPTWIHTFKGHASSSVLRAANAVFRGHDVTLELARPKSLAELTTALDCFIECANLGLRSWGGRRAKRAVVGSSIAQPRLIIRRGIDWAESIGWTLDDFRESPGTVWHTRVGALTWVVTLPGFWSTNNMAINSPFVTFDGWHRGCVLTSALRDYPTDCRL